MGVVSAGKWVVSGFIINMVIRLANNLIMTRLVAPEAFGVVAVATISLLGIQMLSDVGLRQSIIRREGEVEGVYQDTVWVTQIIKGILVSLIMLTIAAMLYLFGADIGGVYSSPTLPLIIAFVSLSPIVCGLEQTKVAMQNRDLLLAALTKIDIVSQLIGLGVSVTIALNGYGIWGLVAGPLMYNFTRVCLCAFLLPGRINSFRFDVAVFRELLHFGKWVVLSSFVTFLSYYGDQLILARYIAPEQLGYVAIAVFFVGVLRSLITKLANDVFFAKLSEVYRTKPIALKATYYKFRLLTDGYLFVAAGGLFASSDLLVSILYDDRYEAVGWILKVFSLSLIFERYILFSALCWVLNIPKLAAFSQAIKVITLFVGLPITLSFYGFYEGIIFIALYKFVEIPLVLYLKYKKGLVNWPVEIFLLLLLLVGYGLGLMFNSIVSIVLI